MKKLLIVLCCTALLLVGLFHVQFTVPTTAKPAGEDASVFPWQNARAMEAKMLRAKELDTADAIKRLPGIADAKVVARQCPEWERNVWARRNQLMPVDVSVEACDNQPIDVDTIQAIGTRVALTFGIKDMTQILIFDDTFNKVYDGAGQTAGDIVCSGAPAQAGPDIGKFRLPIEYPLHNIPAESLIEFLAEEFPQVKIVSPAEESIITGIIEITASLTDHQTIMKMLTDLKREIESVRNEAAGEVEEESKPQHFAI